MTRRKFLGGCLSVAAGVLAGIGTIPGAKRVVAKPLAAVRRKKAALTAENINKILMDVYPPDLLWSEFSEGEAILDLIEKRHD